jgi:hypothetical protein
LASHRNGRIQAGREEKVEKLFIYAKDKEKGEAIPMLIVCHNDAE